MSFFETIYSWFHSFYNDTLWNAVREIVNEEDSLLFADSLYVVGIITLILSFLTAFAYYVWPINHPRFNAWKSWVLMLVIAACVNFMVGIGCAYSRVLSVNSNEEACEFIIGENYEGQALEEEIRIEDYIGFGLSNIFVGSIFFIACCIPLTFRHGNARLSPFRI